MESKQLHEWLLLHYGQEQMRPGLDRVRSVLGELLPSFHQTKIIIIAGTNGKGETTLRLSKLLEEHSHFVWTSPHIERITERFRSEKGEISYEKLIELILLCHEKVSKRKHQLSFYEFLFFVFCTWAARSIPEFLLLEVGLGGRLDAVNIFDADLVLLPSLSRDHQEILGKRYDQILSEKLGTLRKKSTLFHFLENDYLLEKAQSFSDQVGSNLVALKKMIKIPSYEFSQRNFVLAGAAYCYLLKKSFDPKEWTKPVSFLEHRGEVFKAEHEWLFFGSHNVDGLRKLIQFLQSGTYNFKKPPFDAVVVAFSKRSDHDLKVMMKMLKEARLGKVVVTIFDHPKAASLADIKELATQERLEFAQNIEAYVRRHDQNQRILVTGSYYFLGHIKSLFCRQ
jgi:dihydrofolate synthase/folylpolyglutamate synthase